MDEQAPQTPQNAGDAEIGFMAPQFVVIRTIVITTKPPEAL